MKKLSPEEAEKVLEDMKVKIEIPKAAVTQWERNTALDMAIEALKYSEVPNSSDCISRQTAIDAFEDTTFTKNEIRRRLSELPSAQPEIVRCKDCKHHHYDNSGIPYCDRIDYGYGWKDDDYCSHAERRTDG